MSMFCYQCQETAMNKGCTIRGVCGKTPETAKLQDLLIYTAKSVASYCSLLDGKYEVPKEAYVWVVNSLFMTITNANFDDDAIIKEIEKGQSCRETLESKAKELGIQVPDKYLQNLKFTGKENMIAFAENVGVLRTENEDIRSLRELVTYGLKGMSAYVEHASNLGKEDMEVYKFMAKALADLDDESFGLDGLVALTMEVGKHGVTAMALLDGANTGTYGNPEATKVNIGVRNNPGILISGHDLRDLEQLLEQTKGTGVDIYTHSEMLPANSYPAFKKYDNLVGNYGGSWWHQTKEFISFNGPVLFTSNCLVPPRGSAADYLDRIYTTNSAGMHGCEHILKDAEGKKDFSKIIEHAKKCASPVEIENGAIDGGFAHNQILAVADTVVEAIKGGAIKKFVVMAGCDARMQDRKYYTEFAEKLPKDTVILTAGCAKYRYNKLNLGEIGGIPRVLDAGQCNDSYSLALVAMKLQEVFGLDDINDLPIVYNIAWYEQKACLVLLALLHLGVKNIHLGPTLPAFLSPAVTNVLVENFGIAGITSVEEDMKIFGIE
ncbi:hybrid cluster protein (plasmid) [Ilyobacter polytropus DSM 2926]|uniref:Hydroxylamine reductase n=2 Tax=Ilyobacter TaxID=167639 RepID=E3HDW2_ILYPC|nr:hydroxylamine reductase [Ilyobacter polytropus]ADO84574.1 hybrid cluster protein [Ilyobacter polytropus DSM 2926]